MNRNYSRCGSGATILAGRHAGVLAGRHAGVLAGRISRSHSRHHTSGGALNVYFQWMADNKARLQGLSSKVKGAMYREEHGLVAKPRRTRKSSNMRLPRSRKGGYGNSASKAHNPWIPYFERVMSGELTMEEAKEQYRQDTVDAFHEMGISSDQIRDYFDAQQEALIKRKEQAQHRKALREYLRQDRALNKMSRAEARADPETSIVISEGPQAGRRRLLFKKADIAPLKSYRRAYRRLLLKDEKGKLLRRPTFVKQDREPSLYKTLNARRVEFVKEL